MRKLTALSFLACLVFSINAMSQNVGIGTNTPSEKLEVNGNIKITGNINLNGNTGAEGQVLTSQGSNPPIWITPATVSPESAAGQLFSQFAVSGRPLRHAEHAHEYPWHAWA